MNRTTSLFLFLLLAVGCSSPSEPVTSEADSRVSDSQPADARSEPDLLRPHLAPDLGEEDLALDVGGDDSEPDSSGPACAPGEGCFLDPCAENGDCLSGWCVEHMGAAVCSQTCQEECPPGWTCKLLGSGGPDPVYVCVSDVSNLCKPCAANADCKSTGGNEDVCVDYGEEGSFCGGPCESTDDCPWGFSCGEAMTVDGVSMKQCLAEAGVCPCTEKSVDLGLTTPCEVTNEFGTCTGQRVCTEDGLSTCDAPLPAEETCNGVDDDCDGDVDEPALVDGNPVNLCDDGNPCTLDKCQGEAGCVQEVLEAGECIDGDACTIGDHCEAGVCTGTPIDCDDGDPCTDDSCDGLGGCQYEFNVADCDDENPCTVADECNQGNCLGVAINCDCQADADCLALEDGDLCNGTLVCNTDALPYQCQVDPETVIGCPAPQGADAPCLVATCDADTGACDLVPANDGLACSDGDPCTVAESCLDGICQGAIPLNCNDGNPCTDDTCDAEVGGCVHGNNVAPCDDGNICTAGDQCLDGVCEAGGPVDCADANPCTDDSCDPVAGCQHTATAGACDDGNACTQGDHCSAGACVYDSLTVCDDDNVCTTDSCDPQGGCSYALNSAPCDDGDLCTTGDHCHLGECISSGSLTCDDGNLCTDDSCKPATGCAHVPNSAPCDDGSVCTDGDQCSNGWCLPGEPLDCDDGNSCTSDSCSAESGCVHGALTGACDDGDACTQGDVCTDGQCVPGEPLVCQDGNPCTDDGCDAELGCLFVPNQADCDDNDACTVGDQCAGGMCLPGEALDCDDENPCTTDLCLGESGCDHLPLADGTECGQDLVCLDGVCTSCGQIHGSQAYTYTGSKQTFVVPDCVTEITVTAAGAAGGKGQKGVAGKGGRVVATLPVTPGETLNLFVGGQGAAGSGSSGGSGGYNGGGYGTGYSNTCYTGGGGGGATDIRRGGESHNDRVLVAGGGGGGAGDPNTCAAAYGGAGGGLVGGDAEPSVNNSIQSNGKGGTQNAGGAGGTWSDGQAGSFGTGGHAGNAGGGGGGGWYGGGGGGHGGGGGGSSFVTNEALNVTHSQGYQSGHGQLDITW